MTDAALDDPFLWLEETEGERALNWVRAQNERSLAVLKGDPRYQKFYEQALAILNAQDKIPWVGFGKGDAMGNFWQDETHVRGLWRETTLDSYRTDTPQWQTILDIDALAATESANWVYKGGASLSPELRKSLVYLSDGGKDAYEMREFDKVARQFVTGGFAAPEGKQNIAWIDNDTLLIARDWGEGTMTKSGYAFVLKRWTRGQSLDQAVEVFRGTVDDAWVSPSVLRSDDMLRVDAVIALRGLNFYDYEYYLLEAYGQAVLPRQLPFPKKFGISSYVSGQVVFELNEAWPEYGLLSGDIASFDLKTLIDTGKIESQLIFRPNNRQSVAGVSSTREVLTFGILDNVKSEIRTARFTDGKWRIAELSLPKNASIDVTGAAPEDNRILLSVTDFLTPTTMLLGDLDTGMIETLKQAPARFDGSRHVTEQLEAVSKDGTRIPYFVIRPKDLKFDGSAPTLLYGYGGFQVSLKPSYNAVSGKLWLENGGVYVLANIRGGGEFGPNWHQAALKENRQIAFDDFFAVADDLIKRGITSPRRLGIMGGSNGGLLMGAALTQRPKLYNAVIIQVPLLDMLRYTVMGGAGASWIGEYGDPEIPEERAFIEAYSPYQKLISGQPYPEVFILTSTKDDRVHPGHARKMVARLLELGYRVLYYENIDGGHGAAANLIETAQRQALEYTYLSRQLMD